MVIKGNSLVSICIPAYKNTSFLKRLLESLLQQTYTHFEVILSDDSPDNTVKDFVSGYHDKLTIKYFKNNPALGTPANWNFAMKQAEGAYIKLLHDDDWLATYDALEQLVTALEQNPAAGFVFSAYNNVYEDGKIEQVVLSDKQEALLREEPLRLFIKNFIGHPSVILHRRTCGLWYDETIKWVVDFEAYIRVMREGQSFIYIKEPLLNIGLGKEQVTFQVFRKRAVELPENIYLLNKLGIDILKNIWVYDYYWRFLRNLNIRSVQEIVEYVDEKEIPVQLKRMVAIQKLLPNSLLKIGVVSKFLMGISFLINRT